MMKCNGNINDNMDMCNVRKVKAIEIIMILTAVNNNKMDTTRIG